MVVMSTGIGQIQQATDKQFLHYQQQMAKNQQAQIQQKVSKHFREIIV